jgi:hypothetical protein
LQARCRPVVSQLQGRLQPGLSFVLAAAPPPLTARCTGGEAQLWPSYGQLWPAMAGDLSTALLASQRGVQPG